MQFIHFTTTGRKHGPRFNRRTIVIDSRRYNRRRMNAPRGWRWMARPCELILSKLASLEIERVGVALRNNLISVPQAISLLDADDALDCFKFGGGPDHA